MNTNETTIADILIENREKLTVRFNQQDQATPLTVSLVQAWADVSNIDKMANGNRTSLEVTLAAMFLATGKLTGDGYRHPSFIALPPDGLEAIRARAPEVADDIEHNHVVVNLENFAEIVSSKSPDNNSPVLIARRGELLADAVIEKAKRKGFPSEKLFPPKPE